MKQMLTFFSIIIIIITYITITMLFIIIYVFILVVGASLYDLLFVEGAPFCFGVVDITWSYLLMYCKA